MDQQIPAPAAVWPPQIEEEGQGKRGAARRPAGVPGRLAFGGLSTGLVGCEILDLSDTGARVEVFARLDDLPEYLSLAFGGTYHRVRRCWMRDREIGLEFIADDLQYTGRR